MSTKNEKVIATRLTPEIEFQVATIQRIYEILSPFAPVKLMNKDIVTMAIKELYEKAKNTYTEKTGKTFVLADFGNPVIEPELPFKEYQPASSTEAFTDALIDDIEQRQEKNAEPVRENPASVRFKKKPKTGGDK